MVIFQDDVKGCVGKMCLSFNWLSDVASLCM